MKIDWMIMGEGVTQDSRGAWAIVGLGQDVFGTGELPAQTKRAVLTHVSDLPEQRAIDFTYSVYRPNGKTLVSRGGQFSIEGSRWDDIPSAGIDLPAEFVMTPVEMGTHRIVFEMTDDESEVTLQRELLLHVVDAERFAEMPEARVIR